jgi:peptidyl-prolyl cis-trans isomerase SDCCAG10
MLQAYDGQVRQDLDHDKLMPAAWRLEKYLDADDDEDITLDSLRGHRLVYNKERPGDEMARKDNVDDLVVSLAAGVRLP